MSKKLGTKADAWRRYREARCPYIVRSCAICANHFNPRGKQKWCALCQWMECPICGAKFSRTRSARRFCSQKCNIAGHHEVLDALKANRGKRPRTYHLTRRNKHGSTEDRDWRLAVFKRDSFTCVSCGQVGGRLQADHIRSYAAYPELRHELSNGRTLCVPCHKETPNYGYKAVKEIAAKRMSQEVMAL